MGKLEQQIKQQLEERKITPSAGSWDKLSSQLEAQDKKKGNYKWIIGVAASFVAGILIASLFGNLNETEIKVVSTQESDTTNSKTVERENIFSEEIEGELVYGTQRLKEIVGELPEDETTFKQTELVKEVKSDSFKDKRTLKTGLESNKNKPSNTTLIEEQPSSSLVLNQQEIEELHLFKEIDKKAQQVVDNVKALSANREVTDAEIDSLIRQAQLEIRIRNIFEENRNKVNAQALLQHVEAELDHSFRERIFIAIENGFTQVKSAITFLGK